MLLIIIILIMIALIVVGTILSFNGYFNEVAESISSIIAYKILPIMLIPFFIVAIFSVIYTIDCGNNRTEEFTTEKITLISLKHTKNDNYCYTYKDKKENIITIQQKQDYCVFKKDSVKKCYLEYYKYRIPLEKQKSTEFKLLNIDFFGSLKEDAITHLRFVVPEGYNIDER